MKAVAAAYRASDDARMIATANLIVVAFFFLLRVGEYTPHSNPNRRTVPLRRKDVKLWKGTDRIALDSPSYELAQADGVTIRLENQKNGEKGCVLHHDRSADPALCPVRAMVALIQASQGMADDAGLGSFRTRNGQPGRVTAHDIRAAVRQSVELDGLESKGFDVDRVGSHSLRAGGAIMLKLAGYDSDTIKKLGRWSSNTYLVYIQSQIAQLTTGVAERMRRPLRWHAVG